MKKIKVIISGGGTGGHIFPALSIAGELRRLNPDNEILFVGAEGKMEMEKIPAAGYRIIGLPVAGLQRSLSLSNLALPFKLCKSLSMAGRILKEFKPDVVVGVGGYASAPLLWKATRMGIPALIQEQNGFAGLANRIIGKKADRICVAYEGMDRFFPKDKIIFTGNPIRSNIMPATETTRTEAFGYYGLDRTRRQILITGGSLGCRTLNEAMKSWIEAGCPGGENVEVLWQCGKYYMSDVTAFMQEHSSAGKYIHHTDFIGRMDLAYAAADIVVARSGASTLSELCAARKAVIFVPSPNVTNDHQTHNAMALVEKNAALMVTDSEAPQVLMQKVTALASDAQQRSTLEENIGKLARPDAVKEIAAEVYSLAGEKLPKETHTEAMGTTPRETATDEVTTAKTPTEAAIPREVYFLGIGGIGMSAIARYYNLLGAKVSGYDRTPSALTAELEAEGIAIHYEDNPALVPQDKEGTLVVRTPAVPQDMHELQYVQQNGYRLFKRSEILGEITRGHDCLAVAGTHGKTTTSTLVTHIFTSCGEGCTAFIGGISKNYNTNFTFSKGPVVVAEADEFDRSFLQLNPEIAVITSMDADHLDIYSDLSHVQEAFKAFASQVKGTVIVKYGIGITREDTPAKLLRYSYDDPRADFYASDISSDSCGDFTFTLNYPGGQIPLCTVGVPGWVNVENGVAASAIALTRGIAPEEVRKALATFRGVKRRFDIHLNTPTCSYIDDYAHHPREIAAALSSIRGMFPGRKITVVFQPHLYTRTRDFADGFAEALSTADKVILLDIYPARELPIPGVTSELIFRALTCDAKELMTKDKLLGYLQRENVDILVTFGAGDIDRLVEPIAEMLTRLTDQADRHPAKQRDAQTDQANQADRRPADQPRTERE